MPSGGLVAQHKQTAGIWWPQTTKPLTKKGRKGKHLVASNSKNFKEIFCVYGLCGCSVLVFGGLRFCGVPKITGFEALKGIFWS